MRSPKTMSDERLRICLHHVGARAMRWPFPVLDKFERDMINVLYDADPDCLPQLQALYQDLESELHVLPYCLGDERKTSSFYITCDQMASSLLEPNPDYDSFYQFHRHNDLIYSEMHEVVEERVVEVVTMDQICGSEPSSILPPDFLSIDTQGSEYEILRGAEQTLQSSVLALVIEVEFRPTYRDQKLFGEITSWLSERGFDFVRFHDLHGPTSPFRAPIGLRGDGFEMSGDALYFRRLDNIPSDETERFIMLRKLAFISVVFNQFEYAMQCLERSNSLDLQDSVKLKLEGLSYFEFTRRLEEQIARMPKVFPTTTVYNQNHDLSNENESESRFKQFLRSFPILYAPRRHFYNARINARKASSAIMLGLLGLSGLLRRSSCVERLMVSYDLKDQAKILRKNRIFQSHFSSVNRF